MLHSNTKKLLESGDYFGENYKKTTQLKPGDYFGEQSLLKGAPRNATIVAASELKLAVLDAKKFKELRLGICCN